MDLELTGRVAFVSGSYRGTGEGIAKVLAREGAHVLVHGFTADDPARVVNEIRATGGRADAVHGDIASDAGAAQAVVLAHGAVPHVDVLVNNYGVAEGPGWLHGSSSDWLSIYQKNVLSAVRLTQAFVPGMKARGFGRVIFIGTIGSSRPASRMPHYYASKAALPNMTVSLAKELAGTGVTANLVSPGLIATREVLERFSEQRLRDNPAGVICTPEHVGHFVAWLASPLSACVNGANLRIDGGAADCVN